MSRLGLNQSLEKSQGKYPLAFGTSTALEGLMGIHDELQYSPNNRYPYKTIDVLAINVRTLIRNIIHAHQSAQIKDITDNDVLIYLDEEFELINSIVEATAGKNLRVYFYLPKYGNIERLFPHAKINKPTTARQLILHALEMGAIDKLINSNYPFVRFHDGQPSYPPEFIDMRVAYLTHMVTDLLYIPNGKSYLLESHTGKLKQPNEFNTKLKGLSKLAVQIPFNKMTIQMFADKGDMFNPLSSKYRKQLIEIATKYRWGISTTQDKIIANCKMSNNPELLDLVRILYQ